MKFRAHILPFAKSDSVRVVPVAVEDTDSIDAALEEVFAIGNGMRESAEWRARSLSVGDVVEAVDGPHAGKKWVCLMAGWAPASDELCAKLAEVEFSDRGRVIADHPPGSMVIGYLSP